MMPWLRPVCHLTWDGVPVWRWTNLSCNANYKHISINVHLEITIVVVGCSIRSFMWSFRCLQSWAGWLLWATIILLILFTADDVDGHASYRTSKLETWKEWICRGRDAMDLLDWSRPPLPLTACAHNFLINRLPQITSCHCMANTRTKCAIRFGSILCVVLDRSEWRVLRYLLTMKLVLCPRNSLFALWIGFARNFIYPTARVHFQLVDITLATSHRHHPSLIQSVGAH